MKMNFVRLNVALGFCFVLSACSSGVSKPRTTVQEEESTSALNADSSARENFLNKYLKQYSAEVKKLSVAEVRVRETDASTIENAKGTFALVEFLNGEAQLVGETSIYYFSTDRTALKIDKMREGLEIFMEQTGPENAKLATSLQPTDENADSEIYLLTPYTARVISNREYDLSIARDRAEYLRFKRSWKELTQTWSCKVNQGSDIVCR